MLPKKYHAILFICILVMLLLLGLHLLGIGFGSSSGRQAAGVKSAALTNSSALASASNQSPSSSSSYRHPIVYDKLTGANNNQINDVLGSGQKAAATGSEYPLDHYQQSLQQQQQQQQQAQQQQFNPNQPFGSDDFFNSIHRQEAGPAGGFPSMGPHTPPPLGGLHPIARGHHPAMMQQMMPPTTQSPMLRQQQQTMPPRQLQLVQPPLPPMAPPPRGQSAGASDSATDSLPSASSLNSNNGAARQPNEQKFQLPQQQPPANHQPVYYTPPIFAYNSNQNLEQPQARQPQHQLNNEPLGMPFGFIGQQQPPIGVPEPPLSIDEYNARQARLRPQQQLQSSNEVQQVDRYGQPTSPSQRASLEPQFFSNGQPMGQQQPPQLQNNPPIINLLADPQQQQRHKQQMLDLNQLLFGPSYEHQNNSLNSSPAQSQASSYYPDPALNYQAAARPPPSGGSNSDSRPAVRPPYAHNMMPPPPQDISESPHFKTPGPISSNKPPQAQASGSSSSRVEPSAKLTAQPQKSVLISTVSQQQQLPTCARQQPAIIELVGANSSSLVQPQTLFCNEDPEYPTKDVMRALGNYATERSIEQLLPQPQNTC